MFTKQTFEQNIYMKMFRWAYIFLMINICFVMINIPFFIAVTSLAIDPRNIPLFLLSFLLVGPGIIASMGVIDVLKDRKDVDPVKEFFKKYKKFAFRGFSYGLLSILGLIIGLTDIFLFMKHPLGKWIVPFFIFLVFISLVISINSWYFQIRNPDGKMKEILQIAVFYSFRKWYVSLLNIVLLLLSFTVMLLKPQFGFILSFSLFLGLIYLNNRFLLVMKDEN